MSFFGWFKQEALPTGKAAEIYQEALDRLGQRVTLDPSVPAEVGCAEAVSAILKATGYPVPPNGIPTVNGIIDFCLANGFIEVLTGAPGDVITAHSPDRNNPNWAHTGIVMKYGVASNTSFPVAGFYPGEWAENYPGQSFQRSFTSLGSQIHYFSPVDTPTQPN